MEAKHSFGMLNPDEQESQLPDHDFSTFINYDSPDDSQVGRRQSVEQESQIVPPNPALPMSRLESPDSYSYPQTAETEAQLDKPSTEEELENLGAKSQSGIQHDTGTADPESYRSHVSETQFEDLQPESCPPQVVDSQLANTQPGHDNDLDNTTGVIIDFPESHKTVVEDTQYVRLQPETQHNQDDALSPAARRILQPVVTERHEESSTFNKPFKPFQRPKDPLNDNPAAGFSYKRASHNLGQLEHPKAKALREELLQQRSNTSEPGDKANVQTQEVPKDIAPMNLVTVPREEGLGLGRDAVVAGGQVSREPYQQNTAAELSHSLADSPQVAANHSTQVNITSNQLPPARVISEDRVQPEARVVAAQTLSGPLNARPAPRSNKVHKRISKPFSDVSRGMRIHNPRKHSKFSSISATEPPTEPQFTKSDPKYQEKNVKVRTQPVMTEPKFQPQRQASVAAIPSVTVQHRIVEDSRPNTPILAEQIFQGPQISLTEHVAQANDDDNGFEVLPQNTSQQRNLPVPTVSAVVNGNARDPATEDIVNHTLQSLNDGHSSVLNTPKPTPPQKHRGPSHCTHHGNSMQRPFRADASGSPASYDAGVLHSHNAHKVEKQKGAPIPHISPEFSAILSDIANELQALSNGAKPFEEEIQQLNEDNHSLRDKIKRFNEVCKSYRDHMNGVTKSQRCLEEEYRRIKRLRADLVKEKKVSEKEVSEKEAALGSRVQRYKAMIKENTDREVVVAKQLKAKIDELDKTQKELEKLKKEKDSQWPDLKEARATLKTRARELEQMKATINTHAAELEKSKAMTNAKCRELSEAKATIDTKEAECDMAKGTIEVQNAENIELNNQLQTRFDEIATLIAEKNNVALELEKAKVLAERFEKYFEGMEPRHTGLVELLSKVQSSMAENLSGEHSVLRKLQESDQSSVAKIDELLTIVNTLKNNEQSAPSAITKLIEDFYTRIESKLEATAGESLHESTTKFFDDCRERLEQLHLDQEDRKKLTSRLQELLEDNSTLSATKDAQELQLKAMTTQIDELKQDLSKCQSNLIARSDELNANLAIPREDPALQEKLQEAETAYASLEDQLQETTQEASRAKEDLQLFQETSRGTQDKVEQLERKVNEAEVTIKGLVEEKKNYIASCKNVTEKAKQEGAKLAVTQKAELIKQHEAHVKSLEQQRMEVETHLGQTREDLNKSQADCASQINSLNRLQADLNSYKDSFLQQKVRLDQLERGIPSLESFEKQAHDLQAAHRKIDELQQTIDGAQNDASTNIAKSLQDRKEFESKVEAVDTLKREKASLEEHKSELQQKADASEKSLEKVMQFLVHTKQLPEGGSIDTLFENMKSSNPARQLRKSEQPLHTPIQNAYPISRKQSLRARDDDGAHTDIMAQGRYGRVQQMPSSLQQADMSIKAPRKVTDRSGVQSVHFQQGINEGQTVSLTGTTKRSGRAKVQDRSQIDDTPSQIQSSASIRPHSEMPSFSPVDSSSSLSDFDLSIEFPTPSNLYRNTISIGDHDNSSVTLSVSAANKTMRSSSKGYINPDARAMSGGYGSKGLAGTHNMASETARGPLKSALKKPASQSTAAFNPAMGHASNVSPPAARVFQNKPPARRNPVSHGSLYNRVISGSGKAPKNTKEEAVGQLQLSAVIPSKAMEEKSPNSPIGYVPRRNSMKRTISSVSGGHQVENPSKKSRMSLGPRSKKTIPDSQDLSYY